MTDQGVGLLRELLPRSFEQLNGTVKEALCKEPGISQAKLAWEFIGSESTQAIRSVLDVDVFTLVARGWCMAKELHEYADEARHPQGERSIVYLGKHAFVTVIHPVLDITIGSCPCVSLRFALELAANFRAVALSIADGHITGVGAGDGSVSARLKYGDVLLHSKETRKLPFPLRLDFSAPGLTIG